MNTYTKNENKFEKELYCECGNDTFSEGFFPCDKNGNEIEPTIESDWNGTYVCGRCGEIKYI